MEVKIALLRGINVGGKRKLLMADLKKVCLLIGWTDVTTYIQSGNIVFNSDRSNDDCALSLKEIISSKFSLDVPVIVKSFSELENIINENPFTKLRIDISQLYLTFLKSIPNNEDVLLLSKMIKQDDQFIVRNSVVYIRCFGKYHRSKLTNDFFETKLKVEASTRNWKTILKLSELAQSI
nr:DUF1697 domain-containing protein [uncultured Carboxylicivirga sp.]